MTAHRAAIRPETINQHLDNVYPALAVMAGMQLELFTALDDALLSAEEAARRLDVAPAKLQPLLYALVTAGLLEFDDGRFRNGAEAREFLIKGRPRYIGGLHSTYADLWSATMHTAASIRSGVPQAKHDFSSMSQEELSAFIRGLDAGAAAAARRLDAVWDFSRFKHVVDAGGGSGALALMLARMHPGLRASVAELTNVAPVTRESIAAAGATEVVGVVETDLLAAPLSVQCDAVVMRAVLQVMSAADAALATRHAAAALAPGGELFVFGRMLDDSRLSPPESVAVNVMFLNVYDDGQAWTEAEHRAWFADAGLTDIRRDAVGGGFSIMRGVRA